ncbi:MAG: GEVED domain-containing protein, partial [Flavobacteriia bacterium]
VGTTRMRIVNINYGTPGTYNYAHYTNYYGESEDYCVTITLPPPCAGTPTPGNTIATPNSVFAGQTTTLTLQNVTSGTGITYQWQSGPTATGPWTNITGATNFNYVATPTASTWYQCVVTCSNSASSGTSDPVQVLYNPYCNPAYTYGTQYGDLISNVAITGTTLNNNSGTATNGPSYTYYSNLPAAVMQAATSYQVQVTCGSFPYQAFAVWIDYNDNYIFEPSEKVGFSTAYTTTSFQTVSFNINLACTPPLGVHRMRVRGVYYTPGASIDPCASYFYGETEDYNVNIIAAVPFTPSFTVVPGNQACTFTDYTYTTQSGMQSYTWGFPGTAGVNYNIISGGTSTSNTATVQYLTAGTQTVSINYLNASGCASTGAVNTSITVQATAQIAPLAGTQTVCAGATVNFSTTSTGGTWSSSNPAVATINPNSGVVTGVAAGTATMTYTIPNTTTWCPPSTATRTVTVLPAPIVNAGNDVTICSGQSNNMNATVNFNTSCTHTIILYDTYGDGWNGCTATVLVGGVPVLTNIGITGWGSGPVPFTFTASNGAPIQVTFSAASWPYEPYYTIQNGAGANLVTNYFPYANGTWNGTASGCPSITPVWSPATGLSSASILNPVASPTATTTYTVSATGTNGCVGSDQVVVNVNPSPANAPVIAPSVLCVGNNGLVSNPVPNGTWSSSTPSDLTLNPATGDIVGVSAGTGTVSYTTTAVNGCTTTTTANIAVQALPVATISSSNGNSICQGTATTLTAPAAASYAWNNGATTQSIAVTAGGNYSVIITSAAGCVSNPSAPLALTVNQPPVANVALNGPASFCQGGSVVLTASGGTSYNWSNSVSGATNTITASGTYTATVTNAAGCSTVSAPVTVDVLPAPAASITANGPTSFCDGGSVILSANGAGAYTWSNGSTASSIAVNNSGSFTYTVTGANGCTTTTAPTAVAVTPLPVVAAITGANTVCEGAATAFNNATTGGVWSSSNAAVASVDATGNISGLSGGNATISYTVTNNGCSTTQTKNISVQTAPATAIAVSGPTTFCAGGSVVLSAANGSGYAWTNTATSQSITVTQSGTYGVSVTNGQGCASIAAPVTINVVPFPVLDPIAGNNSVCIGATTTLSNTTAGGTWSSSNTSVASVSTAGEVSGNNSGSATITYTYTNAAGCTSTVTKPIAVNVIPSAVTSISGPTTFCAGNTVTLTAPAAGSYLWSTNETTQSITVAASGTYDVDVTTAGCTASSAPITVTVNALPTPVVTTNNVAICQGAAATLSSTPASSYAWSNGATTSTISVTTAGNYTVTVTDANGCSATSTPLAIAVSANPTVSIAAAGATTFCQGQSVVLNTNTNGSSYVWSNGATTPSITANTSGLYFVTVTNAAGCSSVSNEITVTAATAFVPTITAASPTTVCAGAFSTLVASPGASYVWSNGATTQGVNVGVNGPITVTVTNSLGCTGTSAPINVTVLPVPTTTITASGPTTFCEGGSVTLTAGGANSYIWANNSTATSQTVTTAGTYVVTGYAANGCPDLAEITVTVNESPSADLITDGNNSLCPGEVLTLSAQPGNVYSWTPGGSTAQELAVTTPGTYSCVMTSLNGCTTTSEQVVVTAAQPTSTTLNVTALENYVLNEITYTQS